MPNYADIESQYSNNKDLHREDVKMFSEWANKQLHLPKMTELQQILFLHSCYYSIEATKQCVDNYFTVRTHCSEFFTNRDPSIPDLQRVARTTAITVLPKLTPEGYCIFYNTFIDLKAENFIFNDSLKFYDMMASLYLQEAGALQGHIIVFDMQGVTLAHVMRLSVMSIKKFLYYLQEALPFRLKGFHFINAVPFIDKILAMMKPFMKKELSEMLQIHYTPNDSFFKIIPKECLLNHIGGSCGDVKDIHDNFYKKMIENTQYFIDEEKQVVDESQRSGKPKNAGDLFGVEGTFKKLDID